MSIVDALAALTTRLETVSGIVTVLEYVTEKDPPASDLPLICIKVLAPITQNTDGSMGGTMGRRTLLWPLELYFFGCVRSTNIRNDLVLVLPFLEQIVGTLDADLTLDYTLDSPLFYPEPIGGDPGVIGWVKAEYTGFVLKPILPIATATPYV